MRNGKLNYKIYGYIINNVYSIYDDHIRDNSIVYSKAYNKNAIENVSSLKKCILIFPKKAIFSEKMIEENKILLVESPRLEYTKLMIKMQEGKNKYPFYEHIDGSINAVKARSAILGIGCIIEPFVSIGSNVTIGNNCIIKSGAKILENVTIGNNVTIKSNAVIGGSGFGVETDSDGVTYKIPHIGGVVIEDYVEIGALTTVCSGTINPTRIGKYTKIDDHVHIGHNVQIKKSVIITACSEVSRSEIGDGVWIGPNSSIIQGVTIGKNALIGIGSVVTKSVNENQTVLGNPAQDLEEFKHFRKRLKEIVRNER